MNVLSLFDGMSCGQIALNRAGIKHNNYFASEIDKYAIKVTQTNYPNTIQIGDIVKVKGCDLPEIDLLIGGSQCQGFSFAGKQLNFNDPRSALFFEYVRLLDECKPKCFLLENVKMKKEHQDVISKYLGVQPILINSNLVSAQNRNRLYWTTIPSVIQPEDKRIFLKDILQDDVDAKYNLSVEAIKTIKSHTKSNVTCGKSPTITTELAHQWGFNFYPKMLQELGQDRRITPIECERLQTVPDDYTSCVSDTQRYKILGNGWTVDIIAHLFKNIN